VSLPPVELRRRVGAVGADPDHYVRIGRFLADALLKALPADWTFDGKTILDFGGGAGRVLSALTPVATQAECFVLADIDGPSIEWLAERLQPPFQAVQTGELPPLPFHDDTFDLVYAVSVFTHLDRTWREWLLELRRVARPDAVLLLSFQGEKQYARSGSEFPGGMVVTNPTADWSTGGPQVFHSPEWILDHWGELFRIERIIPDAFGVQDLAVLGLP
jgi:SAM-dependent methyltransferase